MFSGIVQALGIISDRDGSRFYVSWPDRPQDVAIGDSISVNGTCLTVVSLDGDVFGIDAVPETLKRSTLGEQGVGARVNLERPVKIGGTLDGHIVQGHVDDVAIVLSGAPNLRVEPRDPSQLRYVVEKGSITIDGVSLTVVEVDDKALSVAVIPHTASVTTLGFRDIGDQVNLEFDVLAKYVERLMGSYSPSSQHREEGA